MHEQEEKRKNLRVSAHQTSSRRERTESASLITSKARENASSRAFEEKGGPARSFAKERGAFLIFALSLMVWMGCATSRSTIPAAPDIQTPEQLLHFLSVRYDSLHNQRVRAGVNLKIDGVRERRASALLRYRQPNDLKLDIGAMGMTAMSALCINDTLRVHLPRGNHYLEGPPDQVLHTVTGVDFSYYTLADAVLGLPNLSPLDLPNIARHQFDNISIFLELHHPLWTRRLWLDRRTALLREEHIFALDGHRLSTRILSDYRDNNGFPLPDHIEIRQGEDFIQIDVKTREINTNLTDADFQIRIPSDVTRHTIGP